MKTAKIRGVNSETVHLSDILYIQESMDNTSAGASLPTIMDSPAFKTANYMVGRNDVAAIFESYRTTAVDGQEEQHKTIFVDFNKVGLIDALVKPLYPGRQLAENAKSIVLTNSLKLQVDLTWEMIDGSAFPTLTTQQAEQVLAGRDMLNNRLKVKLFELGIVGPSDTPTSVRGGIAEVRASKQKKKRL